MLAASRLGPVREDDVRYRSACRIGSELARHANEEEPGVDDAADQARYNRRNQPVQPATCADEQGYSGNTNQYRGDRVGREPLDVSKYAGLARMAGTPVQREQRGTA